MDRQSDILLSACNEVMLANIMNRGLALEGRVALVTGAAKRLGRQVALHLARQGADLAVHYDASESEARALVQEIKRQGRRCAAF